MSDQGKPPPPRAPVPGSVAPSSGGPRVSGFKPGARMQPLQALPEAPHALKDRLREEAASTALNGVAILREVWQDFRSSDRFFKYKALILAVWFALSGASFVVACPGSGGEDNDFGAKLVASDVNGEPVFMIQNESEQAWTNITLVVNGQFRLASGKVDPGEAITFVPKQLVGPNGAVPPRDLKVTAMDMLTDDGKMRLLPAR